MSTKKEAILRDWFVCYEPCSSVFFVTGKKHLHGTVFHHENQYNCPDGLHVWTTEIVDMTADYAETKNTMYTLEQQRPV